MKLALTSLVLVEAAKNGKGGKHGGVDLSGDRTSWQIPKCLTDPNSCTVYTTLYSDSGSIIIDKNDYKNMNVSFYFLRF